MRLAVGYRLTKSTVSRTPVACAPSPTDTLPAHASTSLRSPNAPALRHRGPLDIGNDWISDYEAYWGKTLQSLKRYVEDKR
jgi:hypothetical protein